MIEEGMNAPAFSLPGAGGSTLSLADYAGKWLVVYFYPKDDTPGCTKEACSLRDAEEELASLGVQVLGVSTDGVKSHENFRNKFSLNFPLLSDRSREIVDLYGVKSRFRSARRVTFLIEKGGRIAHIWNKVNTSSHAEEVAGKVRELGL